MFFLLFLCACLQGSLLFCPNKKQRNKLRAQQELAAKDDRGEEQASRARLDLKEKEEALKKRLDLKEEQQSLEYDKPEGIHKWMMAIPTSHPSTHNPKEPS